jgi:hypothetical protein
MYKTVYKEVEIDVELDDFDDYDLIEELERRGRGFEVAGQAPTELVRKIYEKRRLGNNDYQRELDELIYVALGKIV